MLLYSQNTTIVSDFYLAVLPPYMAQNCQIFSHFCDFEIFSQLIKELKVASHIPNKITDGE